jgi:hypothetical protein
MYVKAFIDVLLFSDSDTPASYSIKTAVTEYTDCPLSSCLIEMTIAVPTNRVCTKFSTCMGMCAIVYLFELKKKLTVKPRQVSELIRQSIDEALIRPS